MTTDPPPRRNSETKTTQDVLPHDELLRYGRALGLELDDHIPANELEQCVRQRRKLLQELDREALLDIIKWSRCPVRQNAANEELACEISRIQQTNYDSLSRRGLVTLSRLRGIIIAESDNTEDIIQSLRKQEGFWKQWHRVRRKVIGSWLSRIFEGGAKPSEGMYQFLPDGLDEEKNAANKSLKRQIEDHGVVGGIASRIRGAADDYIKLKMDEIEQRIDSKLAEIDQRLAEWRDREVANRLKILRITLAFTVLVAILSLGYNYLKKQWDYEKSPSIQRVLVQDPD